MRVVKKGTADVSIVIRIIDSTDGSPETGVVWNTAGIDLQYRREGAANVAITEASLAALTTAHTDGGFLHIGNGYYRLDLPDAACATGVSGVLVHGTVTDMVVIGEYVELVDYDPNDGVRLGLTAIPNAAADAAGGLPISDAGGLDLDALNTAAVRLTAARAQVLDDWINAGRLDAILDVIAADVVNLDGAAMRGTDSAALASVCTETRLAELAAANLPADIDAISTTLGTPANIDAGGATIADNLKKLADDNAGATFDATNDSLTAIRARGDAAWTTGGGGSLTQSINVRPLIPTSLDLADTASVRLGLMLANAVDDLPSTAEITPGTISIDRKAIGGTSWSAVVTDVACSEAAGLVYYDEVFDGGTGYAEGDTIRVTFKSQSVVADANTFEITGSGGVMFYTEVRQTMRGTDAAATATALSTTDGKVDTVDTVVDAIKAVTDLLPDAGALNDLATLAARLTAVRAGYLDELGAANIPADIDTLLTRVTAAVALASVCTEARLSELDAATAGKAANQIDEIRTDTGDIQTRLPAALVGGRMDADVGAKTGNVALSTQEKADVNTEVVDALETDTLVELSQGAPSATPSIKDALMLSYMALRNKRTTTSSEDAIYNDAGTKIAKRTLTDDGSTLDQSELISGA